MNTFDNLTPEQIQLLAQVYIATGGDTTGARTFDLRETLNSDDEGRPALKALHSLTGELGLLSEATLVSVYLTEAGRELVERWDRKQNA